MKHPVDIYVGNRIRQHRHIRGLTQAELAETIGVKFQQVQKYENGTNRVSASRLYDIARALSTDIDMFFPDVDDKVSKFKLDADAKIDQLIISLLMQRRSRV